MTQKQNRRVEKIDSQTPQYISSRAGRLGRANSTSKPKYQWVSSTKVCGRGGDSDCAGLPPPPPPPPPPSDPHYSSTNNRFSRVKNVDGQGHHSTVPRANDVQNSPFRKARLSGTSDASTYKAFASSPSWYRKGDNQIVSGVLSSQSQTEPSDSATTTTPLRGDLSTRASPQFQLSQDFVKEIQVDHNSVKRETADSSISSKQQRMTVSEQAKNESPQLQHENDLGESKNETRLLRPKAKRHVHMNHNSSKPGEIVKPSISNKQLPKQDKQRSKKDNPHLQTKRDLEPSKNENIMQPKGNLQHSKRETPDRRPKDDLEQFKSQTHYLIPRNKRYISVQQKLSKPEATAPVSSVSSKHEAKRNVEQCNTETPNLKSGEGFEELDEEIPDREPTVKRHIEFHQSFIKPEGTISTSYASGRRQEKEDMKKSRKENPEIQTEAERDAQSKGVSTATVMTSAQDAAFSGQRMRVAASSYQPSHISNHLGIPGLHTWTQGTSTPFQMPVQLPIGNSSQVQLPPFVPSLQPYPLEPHGLMHHSEGYNLSPQVSPQLGSQFGSIDGISSSYNNMHDYLKKPASRRPVKITHPETNEELVLENLANRRLDGGSSGQMAHHHMVLQPQSVAYGPSPPMNYFSHMQQNSFSYQSPTSVLFRNSQMLPGTSEFGFSSLGMHDVVATTNTGHAALAYPVSKQAVTFGKQNKSSVSIRSASNGGKQTSKRMDALRVGAEREESNYYSKGFVELPKSIAVSSSYTAAPTGMSSASVSFGKGASIDIDDDGKGNPSICESDTTVKELQNLSMKYDSQSQKLPQEETSDFPDNSKLESLQAGECCNNELPPDKEIQQPDTVSRSPLSSRPIIPGSLKIETINLESNRTLVDGHECSMVSSQVCLPGAQAGFACASVEVPGDVLTEKSLIAGVSSKCIGQNVNLNNTVAAKDAEIYSKNAPSPIQIYGKIEKLCELQETSPFQQTFLHSSCKDGSVNNLRSMEVNQQTMKDPSIVQASACDKHAISGFEQGGSQGSIESWNLVTEKNGDDLVRHTPSLLHGMDSMFEPLTLDSSTECLEVGVESSEGTEVNEIPLSESRHKHHEEVDPLSNSIIGKQKREKLICKADAAVASSDLYRAYKDCDEKLQFFDISNDSGNQTNISPREMYSFSNEENVKANKMVKGKTEPGYQETSELEMKNKFEVHQSVGDAVADAVLDQTESSSRKKYSRDFLLTLSKHTEIPAHFQIAEDMAEALIVSPKASFTEVVDDNSRPSFARNMDVSAGSSSVDHHGHRKDGHHRWTKSPTFVTFETEKNFGIGEAYNFHPGHGGTRNRNMHGQLSSQYSRGIFTGLLPNPSSQRRRINKGADVDQWQRASAFRSPLQAMHKAEKKYEVHKVMDAEEAKQRQLKAILNKLTPENFERLFEQVKEVNIDNAVTLAGLISQIFDKALMEPTFCEMYANFCYHLASELPDFLEGHEKITFKRLLLNKCQEEFERGEREEAEADGTDRDGNIMFSEEEREEKRIHARRRMLGNIRLIGELYKKKMLTERIMHECIEKLLRNDQLPEEEDIEALCKLMCTIGEIIDHPKAKEHMDAYFAIMLNLSDNSELSTRMRFLLKDVIDMRKNNWKQRIKVEGPKKIEELHSDAAQEQRLTHTPSIFPNKRVSTDSVSRSSTFRATRKSERAPFRTFSSRNHGSPHQDVRLEDRKTYQHKTLSGPFPHRSTDNNTKTLGLQGGVTKGMSVRDPTTFYGSPLKDSHTAFEESRNVASIPDGHISIPERRLHNNLKRQLTPKYGPNIFMQAPVCELSNQPGHYVNRGSTSGGGSLRRSPVNRTMVYSSRPTLPSNRWSDEHLREMSIATIREFYRDGNEDEVFHCVQDLYSPSFCPSMISIWVKDSFERKDKERDLLAGLLVNLTKSKGGVLTTSQLTKGFEMALATLEVSVTDTGKAATLLGQLFGRIVAKDALFLKEIKRMVHRYGKVTTGSHHQPEESKVGYEVMKIAFETIRAEKGESVLKEMCKRSKVQLDDFRPSKALKG